MIAAGRWADAKDAYERALPERPRAGIVRYAIALCDENMSVQLERGPMSRLAAEHRVGGLCQNKSYDVFISVRIPRHPGTKWL
jgi:hypothetical protein